MHESFWVAEYNIVHTSCTVLCSEHLVKKFFRISSTNNSASYFSQSMLDNTFTLDIRLSNRNYVFSEKDLPTIYFCTDKENHLNSVSPPVPIMCFAHCTVHCTLYAHRCRCLLVHIIHCPLRFMHKAHCSVECSNGTAFQNRLTKTGEFNAAQASV